MEVEKKFRFGEVKTEELKAEHQEVMSLECVASVIQGQKPTANGHNKPKQNV